MRIEAGCIHVDEACNPLQTKTKHYNMIFSPLIYIMTSSQSFLIVKGFCDLVDNSQSESQTRIKRLTSLILKAPEKIYSEDFLCLNYFIKVSSIKQDENYTKAL